MEALTVVENIEGIIPESELTKAIELAQHSKSPHQAIIDDLISSIKARTS